MTNQRGLDQVEQMLEQCLRADENSASHYKIQILMEAQARHEEHFGKIIDRSARRDALLTRYHEHRAQSDELDKRVENDWFDEILIRIQKELPD